MYKTINNSNEFKNFIKTNKALLIYFSHDKCNVCKVLQPKIAKLINDCFPNIKLYYSDTEKTPEIAAQNQIFTVPTLILYFDGKEYLRKSRNIGIDELYKQIKRPYELMFD